MVLEMNDTRVAIDPGVPFTENYSVDELGHLDAVLYTHQHADHFDESLVGPFIEAGVAIYGNPSVAKLIESEIDTVNDGEVFTIGAFEITALDLPHCLMPDGSEGPENTGFVINGHFFHPGDGYTIDNLTVDTLALPIAGPSVSPKTAFDFAKQVQAKTLIPIHYDFFYENTEKIKSIGEDMGYRVIVLGHGESTEIE